jgi:hypothetical protein
MGNEALAAAAAAAHQTLTELETLLRGIKDADLHRADPDGGWTVAQTVSHLHLSGLLFIADLERLRHQPELFMFREELGHDALGATPPSTAEAADRVASLRRALDDCLPAADPAVLQKMVEVPPFGRVTVGAFLMPIVGHLQAHADQIRAILVKRGAVPVA